MTNLNSVQQTFKNSLENEKSTKLIYLHGLNTLFNDVIFMVINENALKGCEIALRYVNKQVLKNATTEVPKVKYNLNNKDIYSQLEKSLKPQY